MLLFMGVDGQEVSSRLGVIIPWQAGLYGMMIYRVSIEKAFDPDKLMTGCYSESLLHRKISLANSLV